MAVLLLNQAAATHGQQLEKWIGGSQDVFIAVAFLKSRGLAHLMVSVERLLRRKGQLTIVAGTDFRLTEPAALRSLLKLQGRHPALRIHVFDQKPGTTFHPKYYRFAGQEGVSAIIGSSNLTEGGMTRNIELSIMQHEAIDAALAGQMKEFEHSLLHDPRCRLITAPWLATYEVEHSIYQKEHKTAEKSARKKLREITPLKTTELEQLLAGYLQSEKEQDALDQRKANYREAARILRKELGGPAKLGEVEFQRHFERLVGKTGEKLWHSGSLFRKKRFLIAEHRKMRAMILDILDSLRLPPAAMYRRGEHWMGQIKHLGPNIFTEICNTLSPARFAVLNKNPVTSLRHLGLAAFPDPGQFTAADYQRFCEVLNTLRRRCGFADFGRADHFLNYIYWIKRKTKS